MNLQRALEIALTASSASRYRAALPLQKVEVTTPEGYGLATYDHFNSPGYISLQKRFQAAGGKTVTFNTTCIDGKQKTLHIYFLEAKHE